MSEWGWRRGCCVGLPERSWACRTRPQWPKQWPNSNSETGSETGSMSNNSQLSHVAQDGCETTCSKSIAFALGTFGYVSCTKTKSWDVRRQTKNKHDCFASSELTGKIFGASSWHRTTPLPVTGRETNKKERKERKEKQKGIFAILRVLWGISWWSSHSGHLFCILSCISCISCVFLRFMHWNLIHFDPAIFCGPCEMFHRTWTMTAWAIAEDRVLAGAADLPRHMEQMCNLVYSVPRVQLLNSCWTHD